MERILTYAEFSNKFDEEGEVLGNTQADVDALASSTDDLTAPESGSADTISSEIGSEVQVIEVPSSSEENEEPSTEDSSLGSEVEILNDDLSDENTIGEKEEI